MATRTVQVKGLRELGLKLREIASDIQTKVARQATNAAAQVIKKGAKRRAPRADGPYYASGSELVKVKGQRRKQSESGAVLVQPGNVPDNIVVKRVKPGDSGLTSEHVVAVRGKKKYGYASRIGALQEFGTVRDPAGHPFMRPAFVEDGDDAQKAMVKKLADAIEKANK
jgi:HK97 gp10 family phage protein